MSKPENPLKPEWIDNFLGIFLDIRPGEGLRSLIMFGYFTLVMLAYYLIKPASRAMMMETFGAAKLPWGNFSTALIIGFVVVGFDILAGRLRRQNLVAALTGMAVAGLIAIWCGFRFFTDPMLRKAAALSFFVFADVYSVMGTTLFWSLSHDLFSSPEGKRLYGFIGGGGALGGILGGLGAGWLASRIGAANLLLSAIFPLLGTVSFAFVAVRMSESASIADPSVPSVPKAKGNGTEGMKLVLGSSYLQLIAGLVGIVLMASLIIETQFNLTVEEAIPDTDSRTSFMGYRDTQLTLIQLFSQVLLTGWLIRNLGMRGVLLIMPLGDLLMGMFFFITPTLAFANWAKIFDGSLKYGTNQVTKEMLYLPTSPNVKYQAKAFIDVFFHRIAKGLAAAIVLFLTQDMGVSKVGLFYPLVLFCGVWVIIIFGLNTLYCRTMEEKSSQPGSI